MFRFFKYIPVFILFTASSLFADVKIYLFPKVNKDSGPVKLMDIANFEGLPREYNLLGNIIIEKKLYSDGYVDRRELINLLKSRVDDTIFIYGNAVKISNRIESTDNNEFNNNYAVKSGDRVRLIIIKKGIRLEISGIAMEDGSIGDVISIKLKNRKTIPGKIVNIRVLKTEL